MGGTGPGMWTGSVARDAASCPQWAFPGSVGAGGGFIRGRRIEVQGSMIVYLKATVRKFRKQTLLLQMELCRQWHCLSLISGFCPSSPPLELAVKGPCDCANFADDLCPKRGHPLSPHQDQQDFIKFLPVTSCLEPLCSVLGCGNRVSPFMHCSS